MGDFSITLKVADRQYKLKIDPKDEENVRKSAIMINEKVNDFAKNYAFKDKQDLLAMIAILHTTEMLNKSGDGHTINADIMSQLEKIDKILEIQDI